ncbi:MAG TPA: dienelactone hydrolase family protein, partial [Terriglobales bacterium]
ERGVDMPYDPPSRKRGFELAQKVGIDGPLNDIAAAMQYVGEKVGEREVAVVGYCWGGSLAWLAATRRNPAAAVGYYGGQIAQFKDEQPSCPTLLHFGARDAHITPDKVEAIREAHPEIPIHVYDAPHGFNCNDREEYTPEAAREAKEITLRFLKGVLKE